MDELVRVRKELALQKKEKSKLKTELALARKNLAIQKKVIGKRVAELSLANKKIVLLALGKKNQQES